MAVSGVGQCTSYTLQSGDAEETGAHLSEKGPVLGLMGQQRNEALARMWLLLRDLVLKDLHVVTVEPGQQGKRKKKNQARLLCGRLMLG